MLKMTKYLWIIPIIAVAAFGCGKKADSSKPIEQIEAEAAKMNIKDLESTARAYAKQIQGQEAQIDKIKSQLKTLSPKDLLGEKAQTIKADLSKVSSEISELTKRYKIYADKYQAMGGDVSAIKVS